METIKLTTEEVTTITDLRENFNKQVLTLGTIDYQILTLQDQKQTIENTLRQVRDEEQDLYNKLVEKYGQGYISLETEEFIRQ